MTHTFNEKKTNFPHQEVSNILYSVLSFPLCLHIVVYFTNVKNVIIELVCLEKHIFLEMVNPAYLYVLAIKQLKLCMSVKVQNNSLS